MTKKVILNIIVSLTADEGMMLTQWKEGVDILFYDSCKSCLTSKPGVKNWREITEAEDEALRERKAIAEALNKELYGDETLEDLVIEEPSDGEGD